MTPEGLLKTLWDERATAILRTDDEDVARAAMNAAVEGGFRVIEFTLGCPNPFGLIEEFAKRDDLIVGAGTVLRRADARRAVDAGAQFIVSPVVDEGVIGTAVELGAAAMPGTHTASEMVAAHRAGAMLQKLFPAPAGGPAYVAAVLGPLPFLRIVPTNGVSPENVGQWITAGVYAVGFVATLFTPQALRERDFTEIERGARESLAAARAVARPERITGPDPFAASTVSNAVPA